MTPPTRENDAETKRLRARLRGRHDDCHICLKPIDYDAHHLNPWAFQMDHLVQFAHGGPTIEANVAASHRACNRRRSDTIDGITIAAAYRLGIPLDPTKTAGTYGQTAPSEPPPCTTPDGQLCNRHGGTHNPQPGVHWVTRRRWW